jgi:hypothetical protein
MYTAYKYLYYKLYTWSLHLLGKDDLPELNAMLVVAILTAMNIISIPTIVESVTGVTVFAFSAFPKKILWGGALFFILIHYFLLMYDGKYKKIIKNLEIENDEKKSRGSFRVGIYIVVTVIALFGSWYGIYLRREVFHL